MSLSFVHDFQNKIYSSLTLDSELMNIVKKIYIGTIQDGKTPFLLINIVKADDLSIHKIALYSVEFQILAFAKDTNHSLLVTLSDLIIKNLANMNFLFDDYAIEGIKANNISFDKAKDLVLNRLVINYKSFIRRGV
ncbi:MAG: hypothetical protein EKK61_05275 [Rickettsiales bacterium]|nr:MAG: hypothetical protein EKK61_05275 [Rickettsiales bacterium]